MEENEEKKQLFEGKTLDEILSTIYQYSVEERNLALETFKKYDGMIQDGDDLYMSGQHPQGYLDSAHKATENIIKMVTAAQKIRALEETSGNSISVEDIQSILDREGIAPERFSRVESRAIEEDKSVISFPELKDSGKRKALDKPVKSKTT